MYLSYVQRGPRFAIGAADGIRTRAYPIESQASFL